MFLDQGDDEIVEDRRSFRISLLKYIDKLLNRRPASRVDIKHQPIARRRDGHYTIRRIILARGDPSSSRVTRCVIYGISYVRETVSQAGRSPTCQDVLDGC